MGVGEGQAGRGHAPGPQPSLSPYTPLGFACLPTQHPALPSAFGSSQLKPSRPQFAEPLPRLDHHDLMCPPRIPLPLPLIQALDVPALKLQSLGGQGLLPALTTLVTGPFKGRQPPPPTAHTPSAWSPYVYSPLPRLPCLPSPQLPSSPLVLASGIPRGSQTPQHQVREAARTPD